jgi:hypothetical protein
MMMRVRALMPMYYSRRMYAAGDNYEMDDREENEAKILQALGKIEILKPTASAVTAAPTYQSAALTVESEAAEPAPAEPMTTENAELGLEPKRSYRRRDMRAEK